MNDWHTNKGRSPRDQEALIEVIWANGVPSKYTYKVRQLVWKLRGWDHDIGHYRKAFDGRRES